MHIDRELILRLENLAKLELSQQERLRLTNDLNDILKMVEKLNELDTTGIEPLTYVSEEVNHLRPDAIRHQVAQSEALKNAPEHDGAYFKVPKIL
ncbi:MAG: Asp-tRNA(Asn)/Glu-tRNA(Gln) amidotransferase subunit GatC [Saprospiraceae bacterium]|nr:MAG: Asp-tRNA(Asn)/Glu-tRNA(Gln) amidotransferase subunit GatC [Saprospiraceae bacterium]